MTDIIQLLPDYVANQIAAGEVVQRPASVVKELLENSIDAKATKIELIIKSAGKNLIQVVDNGVGMSETDARMAFERHATSKIRTTEDIFNISTKGFRGEALASIVAVSQVDLKTKKKGNEVGTNIYIEGGDFKFQEPIQTAEGANFSVKNLFYNVPARRKFLKKDNIEFRHIIDEFHRVALAHENIEFSLYHDDNEVFKLRKTNLLQRIIDIFGRKLHPMMVPVKDDLDWVKLNGFVAKPEGAKKNRGTQFLFVNGRFFKSAYLNRAVQDAFEGLLPTGYIPTFFLYLELAPEKIDINIHPQKTEVKFENENLIYALIRTAIKRSLGVYNIASSLDFHQNPEMDIFKVVPNNKSSIGSVLPKINVSRDYNPFKQNIPHPSEVVNFTEMYKQNIEKKPSKMNELFNDEGFWEDMMRLSNGYWVYNIGNRFLILDLDRVYRLILLSKKKKNIKRERLSHFLLYSLEYPLNEIELIKYNQINKYLLRLGFDILLDEDNILKINAIPEGISETKALILIENILDISEEYQTEEDFMKFYDDIWMQIQIKSKKNFVYKTDAEELMRDYKQLGFPEYLPDGKKCFVEFSLDELKNKF